MPDEPYLHGIISDIRCEVKMIEDKLDHPDTGLVEIKREIRDIEKKLDTIKYPSLEDIKCEVKKIEAKLDHPATGLVEIKKEIREIEKILKQLGVVTAILVDIKREVRAIEAKLDDPQTGLVEIKREIGDIQNTLNMQFSTTIRTSGPVQRRINVNSVVVVALNNTNTLQTVTITVFIFDPDSPKVPAPGSPITVVIEPFSSFTGVFDVTAKQNFEVQVESKVGMGIFLFAAGRSQKANDPVFPSTQVGANTILNADFVPQFMMTNGD
ncbi:hypothetical protein SAMN05660649_00642 [Desulfotomaculum arcticum]|uniref:Uncharacterized protein n=1 Tax=Desulfotruncus arcticus DSM 17038 TaxID=1121424 RepID=A0A1I2P6W8_9FIRM|nr:hypothetical protein [Desulfotruncus arcticus]SFG09201.1 hypothetical protein SAMN05660649_00642 [Desulfotomaculum arcticum] [Desulfotruncus arcticus DSM 17038]